jgi:glycosyltransferase involved in cell wall biosynthesis
LPHSDTKRKRREPRIVIVIPCLNEEQFVGDIVTRARKYADQVIVIDDGSTDHTAEAAEKAGAQVIKHEIRQGAGAATRTAFEAARRYNADALVTLDGDGQHNPDEIPRVLAPILSGEADLVIGSRFLQYNLKDVPKYRKFGIDVITWLFNFGSKVKVTDSQCCFRAHSRRLIETANITENGFSFSVQVLIQARKNSLVIKDIPVSCIYHPQGSSLNPVVHGLGVAWGVVRLRLKNEQLTSKRRHKDELKK